MKRDSMKRRPWVFGLALWTVAVVGLAGCRDEGQAGEGREGSLLVAAAQSLQGRIEAAEEIFRRAHPEVEVSWTYGGSGALAHQILAGAPIDAFISASDREMDRVEEGGKVLPSTRRVFAGNRMVLIAAESVSSDTLAGWKDLAGEGIRRIAIGDPDTVPAGMYADQILTHLGLRPAVSNRLILGANVRQVLDYVARGEADAGVVFSTDVGTSRRPVRVVAQAPLGTHDPILYPMAVVNDSRHPARAREFIAVLASPEMQAILEREGFLAP